MMLHHRYQGRVSCGAAGLVAHEIVETIAYVTCPACLRVVGIQLRDALTRARSAAAPIIGADEEVALAATVGKSLGDALAAATLAVSARLTVVPTEVAFAVVRWVESSSVEELSAMWGPHLDGGEPEELVS